MFVIVWHTNRINEHTLMLLKQTENKKANRRTGNFNAERPVLDNGLVVEVKPLAAV
jgi:hypothetical protein